MASVITRTSGLIAAILCLVHTAAVSQTEFCADLSQHVPTGRVVDLPLPGRLPSKAEEQSIQDSELGLLASNDYANGWRIVDVDNDGRDDLLVWSIQGSGRFVNAELHDPPTGQRGVPGQHIARASMSLGVLQDPQVFRFRGINYIAFTEDGDESGTTIRRLVKTATGRYEAHTVCRANVILKVGTGCRHPACRGLKAAIERKDSPFHRVEWPHMYMAPAGLAVYFNNDRKIWDFDNSGRPTTIWRIGREHHDYAHISWALLGLGDVEPPVDSALRPGWDRYTARGVLPGRQHDRLRQTLAQQGDLLRHELRQPITLPNNGEFFLFTAHQGRTYWAWDFGEPPLGEQIHILYSKTNKSDYIGSVRVKRSMTLLPCTADCIEVLAR